LPQNWEFEKFTGLNSIIILTKNTDKRFKNIELKVGDAIGVFYNQDSVLRCGGYALITNDENIAIPVWGDNSATGEIKDGFDFNEHFKFKIWNSCCGEELICATELFSGVSYFIPDTISIVKSFNSLENVKINFNKNEWRMVSSNIAPYNSFFKSLLNNKNFCIKDENEIIYFPEKSIYVSNYWNPLHCYEIFSSKKDSLVLAGTSIQPELNPIYVQARKTQIIPYFSRTPQLIEKALAPILNDILLLKDSEGNCFIPDYMYNSLFILNPNEAYKLILKKDVSFVYNSNENQNYSLLENTKSIHFNYSMNKFTGSNAIIVIESDDFENGDEVSVFREDNQVCGNGIVQNSACIITIFGDNQMTNFESEGATENQLLKLMLWKKNENNEKQLNIVEVRNLITNQFETVLFKYRKDSFCNIIASTTTTGIPIENEQSYLEFFFDNIQKKCFLSCENTNTYVHLIQVYDILGNEILKINAGSTQLSSYQIDLSHLLNGIYFIIVKANNEVFTRRFIAY